MRNQPRRMLEWMCLSALAGCGGGSGNGQAGNLPPTVSLVVPATGTPGNAITLTATAADSDDSVVKVEFFDGTSALGEDLTSPYSLSWTPATAGTHSLTARATDSHGAATTSAAVSVLIIPPPGGDTTPPTAALTSPADLATGLTGTITLGATAADDVGVAGVEFQIDGVPIGSAAASAPYNAILDTSSYPAGQHVLRARASDAAGNVSSWTTALVQFGGGVSQPAGFSRNESWVTGLSNATAFAQAPDGRLFIAQQGGALRVVKNGALLATPFATFSVDSAGERGLIGVALHPDFASNGFVYIYSTRSTGAPRTTASAASRPTAMSRPLAARWRSSICRTCRARPITTAAACTSVPTASSTSASARTPTRRSRWT